VKEESNPTITTTTTTTTTTITTTTANTITSTTKSNGPVLARSNNIINNNNNNIKQLLLHDNTVINFCLQAEAKISLDNWDFCIDNVDCKIWRKRDNNTPIKLVRAEFILPFPPSFVYEMLKNMQIRATWDTVFEEMKVIEVISQSCDIIYTSIRSPIGVKNRDFCDERKYFYDEKNEKYILVYKETSHPKVPVRNGYIRASVILLLLLYYIFMLI
jgi:hypothetical protein